MRILLVNPNMTQAMTDTMSDIARSLAGDRAEIVPLPVFYRLLYDYVAGVQTLDATRIGAIVDQQKPDARRHTGFQFVRQTTHHHAPQTREGQQQQDSTGKSG